MWNINCQLIRFIHAQFAACILYSPSLFSAWPTLSEAPPRPLTCFLSSSSMCSKPCADLRWTKGGSSSSSSTHTRTRRREGELKCCDIGSVSMAGWVHRVEKASRCQSHSFLTAGLMQKSCPLQSAPPAVLYFLRRRVMLLECASGFIFTPYRDAKMVSSWYEFIMINDTAVYVAKQQNQKSTNVNDVSRIPNWDFFLLDLFIFSKMMDNCMHIQRWIRKKTQTCFCYIRLKIIKNSF